MPSGVVLHFLRVCQSILRVPRRRQILGHPMIARGVFSQQIARNWGAGGRRQFGKPRAQVSIGISWDGSRAALRSAEKANRLIVSTCLAPDPAEHIVSVGIARHYPGGMSTQLLCLGPVFHVGQSCGPRIEKSGLEYWRVLFPRVSEFQYPFGLVSFAPVMACARQVSTIATMCG